MGGCQPEHLDVYRGVRYYKPKKPDQEVQKDQEYQGNLPKHVNY